MIFYLLAISSAAFYGAGDFVGGLTARRAAVVPVVFLSQASGLVLLAVLLPLLPQASPSPIDLLWGAAGGLAGGVGVALLYRALAIGVMSIVAPTTAVCAVAIPVLTAFLLGERPAQIALVGIVLGLVSIVLVSRQSAPVSARGRTANGSPSAFAGLRTALASGVMIGFFLLTFAQTRVEAGLWPLLAARLLSVTLFGAVLLATKQSIRMARPTLYLAILCGVLDMLGNAFYLLAAQRGPLSIAVTLSSMYPASTVLLARLVLHERLNGWQVVGVGCALAAVLLIVSDGGAR